MTHIRRDAKTIAARLSSDDLAMLRIAQKKMKTKSISQTIVRAIESVACDEVVPAVVPPVVQVAVPADVREDIADAVKVLRRSGSNLSQALRRDTSVTTQVAGIYDAAAALADIATRLVDAADSASVSAPKHSASASDARSAAEKAQAAANLEKLLHMD